MLFTPIHQNLALVISELRATLGKMELALGSIDEAIVWTGDDGGIQWCNTTFDRLVGREHLAVLGNNLAHLLPLRRSGLALTDLEHPVQAVLAQTFTTGEYEFQQAEKTAILEISGSFVELKNGDRTAVLTIQDVTERKRIEEALITANQVMAIYLQEVDKVIGAAIAVENNTFQASLLTDVATREDKLGNLARIFTQMVVQLKAREQELAEAKDQLEAVLNAVPGPISWIDSGGVFVGVNRHLAADFNLSQEAFIGQEVGFLAENAKLAHFLNEFMSSEEKAASAIVDFEVNQIKRFYLIAAQKYQKGNAIVSVGIDITERKQAEESLRIAEENYRSIFENALEGIFQSSPEGRFLRVNPALAKIYGYDSPAEMIANITDISNQLYVDPDQRQEFRDLLDQQDSVSDFEYRSYRKDGCIIWTQIDARAVKDDQGNILYYEGMVQDISDRKCREDELRKQLEELRIEIDHSKREKEVALLTESSFFQEVQQEMSQVDLDEFWR